VLRQPVSSPRATQLPSPRDLSRIVMESLEKEFAYQTIDRFCVLKRQVHIVIFFAIVSQPVGNPSRRP
jgi:hypothetical protein